MIEERDFAVAATIGARRRQEDCSGLDDQPPPLREGEPGLLAVVADGMGGAPAGDQASHIVVDGFLDGFAAAAPNDAAGRLRCALDHANKILGEAARPNPGNLRDVDGGSPGSTLVAALFFADRFSWISVGDSLLLRYRQGVLTRVNPLHSYAVELDERARRNEISAEFAASHPDRAALTSVVLGGRIEEIAQGEEDLLAQDILLLSTDGVDTLEQSELLKICAARATARTTADAIIGRVEANRRAGQDNATVFVVRRGACDEDVAELVGGDRDGRRPFRRAVAARADADFAAPESRRGALPLRQVGRSAVKIRIGRGRDMDLRLDSAGVSRRHAELTATRDAVDGRLRYRLRDCESSNGSRVYRAGRWLPVRDTALSADEPLRLGDWETTAEALFARWRRENPGASRAAADGVRGGGTGGKPSPAAEKALPSGRVKRDRRTGDVIRD